jgi:hypothetical protein
MSTPARLSRKKVYFVKTNKGEWGPVDWDLLRYWLGRGWLHPEVNIRELNASAYVAAKDVPKLWIIAGRSYVADDLSVGTASGKLAISRALKQYLQDELGWPGKTDGLNYYDADKLRNVLEKAFPSEGRPLLDDPDWPNCWSQPCPAEVVRCRALFHSERDSRPATEKQVATLGFFGVRGEKLSVKEASDRLDELLNQPGNRAKFEAKQKAEPATEVQLRRLEFAAKRLKCSYAAGISNFDASHLLDEWYADSELEDEYQEYKFDLRHKAEVDEVNSEAAELRRDLYEDARPRKGKVRGANPVLLAMIILVMTVFLGWLIRLWI